MKRILLLSMMFSFVLVFSAWAQRTVSGTVTDENGEGLPGVNVVIKGTTTGVTTDLSGNYQISVPDGETVLVFSSVGMATQEVTVGARSVVDLSMSSDVKQLSEVVVTAFGVERDEKALGYAVQQVDNKTLTDAAAQNPIDALSGKAAGVQVIRSSGAAGGGSRVTIRGVTSMIGDNQPLIVIDGVRVNNQTLQTEGQVAGTAQSNRLMDLNPDDIKSMSVLKGAAATAMYGTAGSTGVILITTKRGQKGQGLDVNFTSSVQFDEVSTLPELQDTYAQGISGSYFGPETGSSTSWGPHVSTLSYDGDDSYPYDKNGRIVSASSDAATGQPINTYDNVDDFYQTGMAYTNSLSISGGGETATFRLSLSSHNQEGIIPNNEYDRYTVKLATDLQATDKLKFSGSINYTRSDHVRIQQGSNTSGVGLSLYRTPATFDNSNGFGPDAVDNPSSYIFEDGAQRNYRGGGGYDNPFWIVNLAQRLENVDRTFGNIKVDYDFSQWAKLSLNVGTDFTSDERKQEFEINSRTAPGGRAIHDNYTINQTDAYLQLSGGGQFGEFGLNYFAGINMFSYKLDNSTTTGNSLASQGFVNIANASDVVNTQFIDRYRQMGIYASVEGSYANTFFVTVTGRQDYDSRLGDPSSDFAAGDIGFFYPSISTSFVFSELIDTEFLSFGKLRASYAEVGAGPPSPYSTSSVFVSASVGDGWADDIPFPLGGVSGFELSGTRGNPDLKPESIKTFEVGLDARFLQGRVGFDIAYFNRKTEDAILQGSLPRTTGFTSAWSNAGEMTSDGIEITLDGTPVNTGDFSWNTSLNFTKFKTVVDQLAPGLERFQIGGFTGTGIFLIAGQQYGAIFGGAYLREGAGGPNDDGLTIPEGQIVINDDPTSAEYGFQQADPSLRQIGNSNPDFQIGFKNSLNYKRWNLSFLLDWKEGGDIWNGTNWALTFFGRSQLTADTREEAPFAIPGVKESTGEPNDIPIVRSQNYWLSSVGGFGSVDEQFVQDASWIRLREVSLSYSFNTAQILGGAFDAASIGFYGRNLWYDTPYDGVDPETNLTGTGNAQGLDYFNQANSRSYIIRLNLNF